MDIKPIAVWEFYTYKPDLIDAVIDRVTGGDGYSHCGVGFNFSDGSSAYWEAHWADGFVGPKPTDKLQLWQLKEKNRKLDIHHLNFTPEQCRVVYKRCVEMTKICKGYGRLQIAFMYLSERFGVRVPVSFDRIVCSEGLSRALDGFADRHGERRHDEVTPNSAHRMMIAERSAA